ncbi:FMN-binding protein [Kribbella sp. NPDC000426]|uniref:FMN-binding protein n=1 Tax=Kribbella sp. NPDC000426 TaxID=3154255 RepID=UPI00332DF07E
MRRGIKLLMTVATTAVVAVAFRASVQQQHTTTGAAAVVSTEQPRHTSGRASSPSSRGASRTPVRTPTSPPTSPTGSRTTAPKDHSATPQPPATSVVVAGGVVDTQYGPVQVGITVRGGRITKAHTLQHPSGDGQTDQINGYAVPQLNQETMTAQSAQIDTVSGATFTSEGYRQSLQSALDAAHKAGAR